MHKIYKDLEIIINNNNGIYRCKREHRSSNQEWTIRKQRQHWPQNAQRIQRKL